jgi:hypothetical protein
LVFKKIAHPALLTSDESVAAVKNILQLSASLEEVRGKQAADASRLMLRRSNRNKPC